MLKTLDSYLYMKSILNSGEDSTMDQELGICNET